MITEDEAKRGLIGATAGAITLPAMVWALEKQRSMRHLGPFAKSNIGKLTALGAALGAGAGYVTAGSAGEENAGLVMSETKPEEATKMANVNDKTALWLAQQLGAEKVAELVEQVEAEKIAAAEAAYHYELGQVMAAGFKAEMEKAAEEEQPEAEPEPEAEKEAGLWQKTLDLPETAGRMYRRAGAIVKGKTLPKNVAKAKRKLMADLTGELAPGLVIPGAAAAVPAAAYAMMPGEGESPKVAQDEAFDAALTILDEAGIDIEKLAMKDGATEAEKTAVLDLLGSAAYGGYTGYQSGKKGEGSEYLKTMGITGLGGGALNYAVAKSMGMPAPLRAASAVLGAGMGATAGGLAHAAGRASGTGEYVQKMKEEKIRREAKEEAAEKRERGQEKESQDKLLKAALTVLVDHGFDTDKLASAVPEQLKKHQYPEDKDKDGKVNEPSIVEKKSSEAELYRALAVCAENGIHFQG